MHACTYTNAVHVNVRVLTSVVAGGPIMGLMARGAYPSCCIIATKKQIYERNEKTKINE